MLKTLQEHRVTVVALLKEMYVLHQVHILDIHTVCSHSSALNYTLLHTDGALYKLVSSKS